MRRLTIRLLLTLLALGSCLLLMITLYRPGLEAWRALQLPSGGDSRQPGLSVTWYGVSTLLISDGTQAILADPFFSRPDGLWPLLRNRPVAPDEDTISRWLYRDGQPPIVGIVAGHSHYDHVLDAAPIALDTGALLLGSRSTLNVGLGGGLPPTRVKPARPGVPVQIGNFRVTYIPSVHAGATGGRPRGDIIHPLETPAPISAFKQGGTWSILIEHELGSILHHGSAGFVPGALKKYRADLVLLGIALLPDLDTYVREVVDAVGAKRVIPTHWDDFTRPLSEPLRPLPIPLVNLQGFFDDMAELRPDITVQTLPLGEARVAFAE